MLAVFTATALSTNYLMIGISNVKFMDFIVFFGGYLFGTSFGITIGTLTWLVYGTINPYGFNLPILVATIIGETIYGAAGGFLKNRINVRTGFTPDYRFAVIGFLTTFIYDLFTNIVSAFVAGIPIPVALIYGIPFAISHEVSNAAFFGFGLPILGKAVQKIFSGLNYE